MSQTPYQDNPIFYFETIESTQQKAKELLTQGLEKTPAVVVAESQEGGRGRENRVWVSPKGNLYLTFILPIPEEKIGEASNLSLVLGTIVAETLAEEGISIEIKWPNDLLVKGAKIGGILGEGHFHANQYYLLLGLGLNVVSAPNLERSTTALNSLREAPFPIKELTEQLMAAFLKGFESWQNHGFFPFFANYRSFLIHHENDILTIGNKKGRFIKADPTGGIFVEMEGRQTLLRSGEILD